MAFLRLLFTCVAVAVALHIAQDKKQKKTLPEVSEVLSKPKTVFEALTSKISSLNAHLMEAQQEGKAAIEAHKAKYETALEAQKQNNTALARKNNDTSARIMALKVANAELRSKALNLTEQSVSLTAELKALEVNISTADEFVASALTASTEMLQSAPPLEVLKELAQRDAELGQNREHESRLNEIRMSLLQTSSSTSGIDEHDILESLNSAIDDLTREQNASTLALKNAFEKEYQTGEDQHNRLLEKQAELDETETRASQLKERLTAAVKHLENTRDTLLEKRSSLKRYMQQVGALVPPEQKQPMGAIALSAQKDQKRKRKQNKQNAAQ